MKEDLTVIIPFKNEGDEVYKTISSLELKAKKTFSVIVINDGSDDGYDYESLLQNFKMKYIVHKESVGPAASRQEGAEKSNSAYLLLMDAHMRAETEGWDEIIKNAIDSYPRGIFCCLTDKLIVNEGNEDISLDATGYGVSLDLESLKYNWLNYDNNIKKNYIDIPCVMGASYCCSRSYWEKIHGLIGLKSYGLEEQFISIKTLLEGGKCCAIGNVKFAHKFRTSQTVPFKIDDVLLIYNHLYLIETLYPWELKKRAFQYLRRFSDERTFEKAMEEFHQNSTKIEREKEYIQGISTSDFSKIIKINKMFH